MKSFKSKVTQCLCQYCSFCCRVKVLTWIPSVLLKAVYCPKLTLSIKYCSFVNGKEQVCCQYHKYRLDVCTASEEVLPLTLNSGKKYLCRGFCPYRRSINLVFYFIFLTAITSQTLLHAVWQTRKCVVFFSLLTVVHMSILSLVLSDLVHSGHVSLFKLMWWVALGSILVPVKGKQSQSEWENRKVFVVVVWHKRGSSGTIETLQKKSSIGSVMEMGYGL